VVSIQQAISILGLHRLQAIILTLALRDMLAMARHEPMLRSCWRHNLGAALVAEAVAGWVEVDRPDADSAGLLHELGRLAMIGGAPRQYGAVLERVKRGEGTLDDAERDVFGAHQSEVGEWLAEGWGLPSQLREAVSGIPETAESAWSLVKIARWSCSASDRLGFVLSGPPPEWDAAAMVGSLPVCLRSAVQPEVSRWREVVTAGVAAFERDFIGR